MGRTVDINFWFNPRVKALSKDGRYLFSYLLDNPHSNLAGLYYLPPVMMSHETGMTPEEVEAAWEELEKQGLARYDPSHELVWVVDMLQWECFTPYDAEAQAGGLGNNEKSIRRHLASLNGSPLVPAFWARYAGWFASPSEPPLEGVGRGSEGAPEPLGRDKRQERRSREDQERKKSPARAPDDRAPDDAPAREMSVSYPQPLARSKTCGMGGCPDAVDEAINPNFCTRHGQEAAEQDWRRQRAVRATAPGGDGAAAAEGGGDA